MNPQTLDSTHRGFLSAVVRRILGDPRDAASTRRVSILRQLALLLLGASLALPLSGCGGGEDEELTDDDGNSKKKKKKKSSRRSADEDSEDVSDVDEARSVAVSLMKRCRKLALDKHRDHREDFLDAYELLRKAKKAKDDARFEVAMKHYARARRTFSDIIDQGEELAEELAEAKQEQKKADEARAEAEEAKADENAPAAFKEADEVYEEGLAAIGKGDANSAIDSFETAASYYRDAIDAAAQGRKERILAESFRQSMGSYKTRAQAANADVKALTEWQQASNAELIAKTNLDAGDFQQAAQGYRMATDLYTVALKSVMDETAFRKEMELANIEAEKRRKEWQVQRQKELELLGGAGGNRPPPPPAAGGAPVRPPPGTVPLPPGIGEFEIGLGGPVATCVSGLQETFPQQIDDEDDAFLIENINSLSKVARYDPDTGGIELDYSNGSKLQADADVGRTSKKHIQFVDPQMTLGGGPVPESGWVSLIGNTQGFFRIPVPFIYKVRLTWSIGIHTMTGTGSFGAFLLEPKKGTRIRSNFGDLIVMQSGKAARPQPMAGKPGGNANYWHEKKRPVRWVFDMSMDAPNGKTTFETTYDAGQVEETKNRIGGKLSHSGYVGMQWKQTRFEIKHLKICGFLDKQAAVALLRKKLNQPKSKTSEEPEPEPDEPAPDDENPTTPDDDEVDPADEKADKPKKPGKVEDDDFDF